VIVVPILICGRLHAQSENDRILNAGSFNDVNKMVLMKFETSNFA
jgi:hypothetical protein